MADKKIVIGCSIGGCIVAAVVIGLIVYFLVFKDSGDTDHTDSGDTKDEEATTFRAKRRRM